VLDVTVHDVVGQIRWRVETEVKDRPTLPSAPFASALPSWVSDCRLAFSVSASTKRARPHCMARC
jgi:hypothetical protein